MVKTITYSGWIISLYYIKLYFFIFIEMSVISDLNDFDVFVYSLLNMIT